MRRPLGIVVALLLLAGGGYAAFGLVRGDGQEEDADVASAREPLSAFLAAWAGHDARKAASHTGTPDEAASLLTSVLTNLKPTWMAVSPGNSVN